MPEREIRFMDHGNVRPERLSLMCQAHVLGAASFYSRAPMVKKGNRRLKRTCAGLSIQTECSNRRRENEPA